MRKFIVLTDHGNEFILKKSAIVSVDEHPDVNQRAVRVDVGNGTDVYLADDTLEDITERLEK